jgi:hypothetical protein
MNSAQILLITYFRAKAESNARASKKPGTPGRSGSGAAMETGGLYQ